MTHNIIDRRLHTSDIVHHYLCVSVYLRSTVSGFPVKFVTTCSPTNSAMQFSQYINSFADGEIHNII